MPYGAGHVDEGWGTLGGRAAVALRWGGEFGRRVRGKLRRAQDEGHGERNGRGAEERHDQEGVRHTTIFARSGRSLQVMLVGGAARPFAPAWRWREVMHAATMTKESR